MAFRKQPLAVTILAVAAFCAIAVLPVSFMFARHGSLAGLALLEARHRTLLLRSLGVSAGATFVALGIGLTAAVVLARGRAAFRLPLAVLTIAPLFIPPYVIAGTWISLLAPDGWLNGTIQVLFGASSQVSIFSPTGVAWCLGISLFPIVAAIVASGLLGVDRDLVDDAKLTAGRWGVFRGHFARPWLLAGKPRVAFAVVPSLNAPPTASLEVDTYIRKPWPSHEP